MNRLKIFLDIVTAVARLLCLVVGVVLQRFLGFPIETFRLTPDGIKQVPTRYRFSMSAKKGRWKWKRKLR